MDDYPFTLDRPIISTCPLAGLSNSETRRALRQRRKIDRKLCMVYGLIGADGAVRYIGQTRQSLAKRLGYHFREAKSGNGRLQKWIRQTPGVNIICIDSNATWDVSEILWIDRYRREGHDLLNVVRGGADTVKSISREGKLT
jgi:hypothetical protein